MINFKQELEKYKPMLEVEKLEEKIKNDEIYDIIDLLEDILKNIKNGKTPVNDAIAKLRETIKGGNTDAIKADTEALQKAFYPIAEKLYQSQAQNQQQGNPGESYSDGQNYYDAGFEDKTGV